MRTNCKPQITITVVRTANPTERNKKTRGIAAGLAEAGYHIFIFQPTMKPMPKHQRAAMSGFSRA